MNTADPMVIEKFKNLPQKLKDILFSEDTTDTIFSVGKENGLTVFQMEELADEVGLVILGITAPEDFYKNIEKKLALDIKKIEPLARAINEKILNPILGDLTVLVKPPISLEVPPVKAEIQKPSESIVTQSPKAPEEKTEPPIAPAKDNLSVSPAKNIIDKPTQVFVKPIPDPYRKSLDEAKTAPSPKQRIVSWEDVLKNKTKEPETHPDAKIALEKAMNDVVPSPVSEKIIDAPKQSIAPPSTNIPKYAGGKDPYREPLE